MQYIEELRLQECQNKLMELSEDEVNGYKSCRGKLSSLFTDCIEEYPIEMSFFICESFYPIATINNVLKEVDYPRYQFKWQYVAEIVINKINPLNEEVINEKEYICLKHLLKSEFQIMENSIGLAKQRCGGKGHYTNDYLHFLEIFFELLMGQIYEIYFYFCWIVFRGLPLYKKVDVNKFLKVDDYDPDFLYIFMNGFYKTYPAQKRFPTNKYASNLLSRFSFFDPAPWIEKCYFNTEQLSKFNEFHVKPEYASEDEQTLHLRRAAYRKAIGLNDDFNLPDITKFVVKNKILPNSHETKLMRIQRKVIERFYGDQFNINDRDTWTKQIVVVDWLMKEHHLSDREAKAIDMITRPDIARGK